MKSIFRIMFIGFLLTIFTCCFIGWANAQEKFPNRRVTLIISYGVGGGTDVVFRIVAKHAEKEIGQSIVVKNIAGGGGEVGWIEAKNAAPDGYTLCNENIPHFLMIPIGRKAGYHYSDFEPLASMGWDPTVFVVHKDAKWKTLAEMTSYAKDNPGKLTVGVSNFMTQLSLLPLLYSVETGVTVKRVALGGGAGVETGLLGRHVDVGSNNMSGSYRLGSNLRVLAVAAENRSPYLPDVPTFKEQGCNVVMGVERGFVVPKGTPPERVKFWRDLFAKLFKKEELLKDLDKAGLKAEFKDYKWVREMWKDTENKYKDVISKLP
ncbi:MAG: tripartite tricarboxylate transporter substrate binding protein, partial [Candidatus Aminicenantes bacterium]|nr:tripartite tricarboxylate transporter substrate binding protein [Candidatus Aminicenantes bacterium]